jgi:hypothetical protein
MPARQAAKRIQGARGSGLLVFHLGALFEVHGKSHERGHAAATASGEYGRSENRADYRPIRPPRTFPPAGCDQALRAPSGRASAPIQAFSTAKDRRIGAGSPTSCS